MIRNYIVVAFRNLVRHKFFSFINIIGLAISMSVCMAIMMLVADQMMYDRHNSNRDRIYRVLSKAVTNEGVDQGSMENSTTPMPLRDELQGNYTGIEKAVRLKRGFANGWMKLNGQNVNIPISGYFADPEVLTFFNYQLEHGDAATALSKPYSVVLTKKTARKLFEAENPLGLTLKVGDGIYTVTGILKETNHKSHIAFEGLASMATVKSMQASTHGTIMDDWTDFWETWTYIQLEPGKSPAEVQSSLDVIFKKHIASNTNPEAYKAKFTLQHLSDITPGKLLNNPIGPFMPWMFIYFLGGLAGIIMLTSCFNFTNLSIARSLTRAREIGVRKVTGAARVQIFSQFLMESIVVALCALLVALLLMLLVKPILLQLNFARIFQWDLEANYFVYAVFLVFAITIGILAGLFPAVILSGFKPVKVLKNFQENKLFSRIGLRKGLIVTQFTLSLLFIVSVITLYNQLNLFRGKDHGFSMADNIVIKSKAPSLPALKAELLKHANIKSVSAASHLPASGETHGSGFKKDLSEKDWTMLSHFQVDEDYLQNLDLSLIAGSHFKSEYGEGNKNFIVINEEAVKALHFKTPLDAIGEEIIYSPDSTRKKIIGVVANYNHQILLSAIEPMTLLYSPDDFKIVQVRYTGSREEATAAIKNAWNSVNPDLILDYNDFEQEVKRFYNIIFGDLVHVLAAIAFLAILISCLGLLGMATYSTETRIKEISIRKVLGSSDRQLVVLLSSGFLTLLGIAVVLGVPLAWFINGLWLEQIAYHTEIGIGIILTGIMILLVVGTITIGSQTLRAAFTNPVDNLKNE